MIGGPMSVEMGTTEDTATDATADILVPAVLSETT